MKQVYELVDDKTKEEIQNEIKSLIIEKAKNQIEDIETYLIDESDIFSIFDEALKQAKENVMGELVMKYETLIKESIMIPIKLGE